MTKSISTESTPVRNSSVTNSENTSKKILVAVELNDSLNAFLTESAKKHGRSKRKELANILEIYRILALTQKIDQTMINM